MTDSLTFSIRVIWKNVNTTAKLHVKLLIIFLINFLVFSKFRQRIWFGFLQFVGKFSLCFFFITKQRKLWGLAKFFFSPMSPKLVCTYPHKVENQGITMAALFLWLISWKSPPQSIEICAKLNFFTNVLELFALFLFTMEVTEITADCTRKEATFWFLQWQNCELIGDDFFMILISKIMVPLEFPGFLLKSVHFKNTVTQSSFHSKQSQLMYYWKWS